MNSKFSPLLLLLTLLFVFSAQAFSAQDQAHQLVLIKGQSRLLPVLDLTRVAVGDESIVDVLALSSNQLLLNGIETGVTSLHVWEEDKQRLYQIRVVPDDGTLARELLALINIATVSAWFIEDHLIIEGRVETLEEKNRVEKLAYAFSAAVINLLDYDTTTHDAQLQQEIGQLVGDAISVTVIYDTVVLEGILITEHERERAYQIAKAFRRPVVNLLQVMEESVFEPVPEPVDLDIGNHRNQAVPVTTQIYDAISEDITVEQWGKTVFIEGFVATEYQRKRALAIAKAFAYPVIDLLRILPTQGESVRDEEIVEESVLDIHGRVAHLRSLIETPDITISLLYENIVLEGVVDTPWEKQRALTLAQILPYPVIDLMQVANKTTATEQKPLYEDVVEAINRAEITVSWLNRTLVLEGTVSTEFEKIRALAIGHAFSANVVDLIRVRTMPNLPQEQPVSAKPSVQTEPQTELQIDPVEMLVVDGDRFQAELITDLSFALREPTVTVNFYRDTLVLEGLVASEMAKKRAEQIAALYYQPTLSFLEVIQPGAIDMGEQLLKHLDLPHVSVIAFEKNIVLEGVVTDQAEHGRVLEIAKLYGNVVDLLHVQRPAQVLLQVRVLEINKNISEEWGVTWGSLTTPGEWIANSIPFEEVPHIGSWIMNRSFPLGAELEALIVQGDAKLLAAPSLLTLSGETASFLAGGKFPIGRTVDGESYVEWQNYGIHLTMSPLVLQDKIRVTINPEVSTLDWTNGVRINNDLIPGLTTRTVSTTVTLTHGSTVVIGGLIQQEEALQIRKVPILGDLPIIGALFQSRKYLENQTELVILITPWIVYQDDEVALYGTE